MSVRNYVDCVVSYLLPLSVNAPDLVLFVGEALVGNEAIDQLVKFNAALADHSSSENPHTIDGIVLTKFDTIDDKVLTQLNESSVSNVFLFPSRSARQFP